jgi:hypothetical protein
VSWTTAPPAIPHFASTRLLRYGTKRYEVNDHLGNVRASISDRRQFSSPIFDPVITDATDYFPFGAPNRTLSSSILHQMGAAPRWHVKNVEYMLLCRGLICTEGRWEQFWQFIDKKRA